MKTGRGPVILIQTDFGDGDSGILHLFGVCKTVCPGAQVYSLRNDIPKFDVSEASRSLKRALAYWPAGTVFVSAVVDPEIQSPRSLCIARSTAQQYIVAPDNGTISGALDRQNIVWVRDLSDVRQDYLHQEKTEICHGRDFAYCAARAARQIPEITIGTLLSENEALI